ncbi:hypothetical protein D9M71_703870 [compost metagenome]
MNTAADKPNSVLLARAMASLSSTTTITGNTLAKLSSATTAISSVTSTNTVGGHHMPPWSISSPPVSARAPLALASASWLRTNSTCEAAITGPIWPCLGSGHASSNADASFTNAAMKASATGAST